MCAECRGGLICEHNGQLAECLLCWESSICEHNTDRSACLQCWRDSRCEHKRHRAKCLECNPFLSPSLPPSIGDALAGPLGWTGLQQLGEREQEEEVAAHEHVGAELTAHGDVDSRTEASAHAQLPLECGGEVREEEAACSEGMMPAHVEGGCGGLAWG